MASQEKPVVAFLGPEASYTHQATLSRFPEPQHTLSPQPSIAAIFAAVHSGLATHGVVPFENSSNGSVVFTLDLFASAAKLHSSLLVTGEIYLPVRHCLVGLAASAAIVPKSSPSASESEPYAHITKLYSHPQAWGQCKAFLAKYFPRAERQDVSSTSRGAALAAEDKCSAAIASSLAAESNGLAILAEGIEDVRGNCTRFLVLSATRDDAASPPVLDSSSTQVEEHDTPSKPPNALTTDLSAPLRSPPGSKWKTLLTLTISHRRPGALADSLAVFKAHGINLTSINSRPSGEAAWHYVFFVEFQGRWRGTAAGRAVGDAESGEKGGGEGDEVVDEALRELGRVTEKWRWLGSWENALVEGREE